MDCQREFAIQVIAPTLSPDSISSSFFKPFFNGKELQCVFDAKATVYIPKDQLLHFYQVGSMECPKFLNAGIYTNITTITFEQPIRSVRNVFYLVAQLPHAVSIEFYFRKRNHEPPICELQGQDTITPELMNKSIVNFKVFVELVSFIQQPEEVKLQAALIIGNIIVVAARCFSGLKHLSLELPDDPNHFMYKCSYDLIQTVSSLQKACITTEPDKHRISCILNTDYTNRRDGNNQSTPPRPEEIPLPSDNPGVAPKVICYPHPQKLNKHSPNQVQRYEPYPPRHNLATAVNNATVQQQQYNNAAEAALAHQQRGNFRPRENGFTEPPKRTKT